MLLKNMLNSSDQLDLMFNALADRSRRAMLEELSKGPASASDLARPFDMSLPGVMQHLKLLENSGLIRSDKIGRVRMCALQPKGFELVETWVSDRRKSWNQRLDRLGAFLNAEDEA